MKRRITIIGCLFVFGLFLFISMRTPLAGDDWGYALNGMKGNPIKTAIEFYNNWSGRFFSELYGFVVTPKKWLWNILNPLLFTSIFYVLFTQSGKKNLMVKLTVILFLILSVNDHLRMETYSWLMGTTYVIPLALSLLYFNLVFKYLKKKNVKIVDYVISNLFLIVIGLMMENIALVMIFATIILLWYSKRNKMLYLSNVIASILSFIILRLSPGAEFRLLRDNLEWTKISIFEKMMINYDDFLRWTFIENKFLVFTLCIVILLIVLKKIIDARKISISDVVVGLTFAIGLLTSVALTLDSKLSFISLSFLYEQTSVFLMVFYPLLMLVFLYFIIQYVDKENIEKVLFFTVLAAIANGVMMASPIFGARSSIYTVYYLMIVIVVLVDQLDFDPKVLIVIALVFAGLTALKTRTYLYKYNLVAQIHSERLEIISYYRNNPQDSDAWIPRMPIFTVHGADIEPDDSYHFEVFKEFHGLDPKTNITFFFKDEY